jgi:crossover junction endodeoxyribonuclease RuvC
VRILGIDCGTERTGYGVIESDGARHSMIQAGVIKTEAKYPLAHRLMSIAGELRAVIAQYSPDCVAVEDVFHAINARSALKLAHVRGVALLLVAESRLPLGEYSPLEVKMSVVGYGRAEKEQVQMMVRSLLSLDRELPEDASDAVAVAICHATRSATAARIGAGR